jgi:hypothetical protein
MVTTYTDARRDSDGRWLCTVTAGCDAVATSQSWFDCAGCESQVAEVDARIAAKQQSRDEHVATLDSLRDRLAREQERSVADQAIAALAQSEVRSIGEHLEELEAARSQLIGPHTHPVFACETHEPDLPVH